MISYRSDSFAKRERRPGARSGIRFAGGVTTLATVLALFVGCEDGSGVDLVAVKGNVSYDGVPIAEGDILLLPADGAGAGAAGKISGGVYTLETTPGEKRVEIRASRAGRGPNLANPGSSESPVEMYIPAKYNAASTLKETVTADGQTIDFALEK